MFTLIRNNVFRWETPFPQNNQNLVGHLILEDSKCILIDPPCVPGLVESVKRLGVPVSIILTSQNHTRGTAFIASKTGASVYLPEQDQRAVEPTEQLAVKEIKKFEKYTEGEILGLKAFKDFFDFALLTKAGELLVSDNARGSADGRLLLWPESMDPPGPPEAKIHNEFKQLLKKTNAKSLLAGHGYDIIRNLQTLAEKL